MIRPKKKNSAASMTVPAQAAVMGVPGTPFPLPLALRHGEALLLRPAARGRYGQHRFGPMVTAEAEGIFAARPDAQGAAIEREARAGGDVFPVGPLRPPTPFFFSCFSGGGVLPAHPTPTPKKRGGLGGIPPPRSS